MESDINYIIQQSLKGDKVFQEILLEKLKPLIYKNIYKYYKQNEHIIEDLVQEGYIVILKSLQKFEERKNVHFLGFVQSNLTFFYKNHYRNTLKERQTLSLNNKLRPSDEIYEFEKLIENKDDKLESIFERDEINKLYLFINNLSQKKQEVLMMYLGNELTMKEIADTLNITYKAAAERKYTAILKLRRMMRGGKGGDKNG